MRFMLSVLAAARHSDKADQTRAQQPHCCRKRYLADFDTVLSELWWGRIGKTKEGYRVVARHGIESERARRQQATQQLCCRNDAHASGNHGFRKLEVCQGRQIATRIDNFKRIGEERLCLEKFYLVLNNGVCPGRACCKQQDPDCHYCYFECLFHSIFPSLQYL